MYKVKVRHLEPVKIITSAFITSCIAPRIKALVLVWTLTPRVPGSFLTPYVPVDPRLFGGLLLV